MAKKRAKTRTWVHGPPKPPVPDDLNAEVERKAEVLVEESLKPQFIKPPPKDWRWNYIIDILGGRRTWGLSTSGTLTCCHSTLAACFNISTLT
jgi:hypothetical protein